jgi:hypothetical protein
MIMRQTFILMHKVMLVMISFHRIKVTDRWRTVMNIVMDHIVHQVTHQSTGQHQLGMWAKQPTRLIKRCGYYQSGSGWKHQAVRVKWHLSVKIKMIQKSFNIPFAANNLVVKAVQQEVKCYHKWVTAFCANVKHPPMHGILKNCPQAYAQNDVNGLTQKMREDCSS